MRSLCLVIVKFCTVLLAALALVNCIQPVRAAPKVFAYQSSLLKAASINHTSDFEDLPQKSPGNPFTFEKVTYATWNDSYLDRTTGYFLRTWRCESLGLANNSHPDMTLTFGKGQMVTAIGFHIMPAIVAAGEWKITLTAPTGRTSVESFSHKAEMTPHYRGFIDPAGIASERITRPKGRRSPNRSIGNLSRSTIVKTKISAPAGAAKSRPKRSKPVIGPLETIVQRRPGPESSQLEKAVAGVWQDASGGTDAKYRRLFQGDAGRCTIAPVDMRRVIVFWPCHKPPRKWPTALGFACSDGRLVLSWGGEVASEYQEDEAVESFDSAMQRQRYRIVAEKPDIEQFGKRLGVSAESIERLADTKRYRVHVRKVGETEIAAVSEAAGYIGSDTFNSGLRFHWFATRPYPHRQPTLTETLDVFPSRFRVPYLDNSFFQTLGNDKLVKTPDADGFEYEREHESLGAGRVQETWYRYWDKTFAHITTEPDSKPTYFRCQEPQHKGEPIKVKPPPRHPSLRLSRSKRPILQFDQLRFSDLTFMRRVRLFHDLATRIADDDWSVRQYKDMRHSSAPRYVAIWRTAELPPRTPVRCPANFRPYRTIFITLAGPIAREGEERIDTAEINGRWAPREGWAASVQCTIRGAPHRRPFGAGGSAVAGYVPDADGGFNFALPPVGRCIRLTDNYVTVRASENDDFSYCYRGQPPYRYRPWVSHEVAVESQRRFLALYASPEDLRDTVLSELDELRRIAKDQIPRLERVSVTDWRHVRSDNPPRQMPASGEQAPSEEIKEELLEKVMVELDSREKFVRENCQQMHAAINKALPLGEVLEPLLDEEAAEPDE